MLHSVYGQEPVELGERTDMGQHLLVAVEGALPCNDLVWRCQGCGLRRLNTIDFYTEPCE